MIVRMKKVSVVCMAEDREASLAALREAGVLHPVPVITPSGPDLEEVRGRILRAQAAIHTLGMLPRAAPPPAGSSWAGSAEDAVDLVHHSVRLRRELDEHIAALKTEAAAVNPFGDFDPAQIRTLLERGVTVRLYRVSGKKCPEPPQGATLAVLKHDPTGWYVALAGRGDVALDGAEFPLPQRSLAQVRQAMKEAEARREESETRLMAARSAFPSIAQHLSDLSSRQRYIEAREGMGASGRLTYLQGFCPADRVNVLRRISPRQGWAVMEEDPAVTDKVPTLIRNPVWIRPVETLFKLVKILPGYREVDVSVPFLVSLSIFFAMIVGDAGYGLLFLVSTLFARFRMRKAPPEPFRLMFLFSFCTIVWGVITGTYFGMPQAPPLLEGLTVEWLRSSDNVMMFCLILGCLHLSLAHLWNMVRWINSLQAIAQAGWVCVVWSLFFLIRYLLFESPLPSWYVPMTVSGFAAVILFMTPVGKLKSEWINHVMLPLTVMSNFGDVLSYLRLFALGVASVELARAFNGMVASFGFKSVMPIVLAVAVLTIGHGLNIVLSLISVLIHGIRLNALEFSMHLGIEWSGFEYVPFRRSDDGTRRDSA